MIEESISFTSIPLDVLKTTSSSAQEDSARLKEACSELESLFIYYLLKEMRAAVPKSGLIGGGSTEEMYTSMLDLQMAKEIASKREIGISSALLDQLGRKMGPVSECNDEKYEKNEPEGL